MTRALSASYLFALAILTIIFITTMAMPVPEENVGLDGEQVRRSLFKSAKDSLLAAAAKPAGFQFSKPATLLATKTQALAAPPTEPVTTPTAAPAEPTPIKPLVVTRLPNKPVKCGTDSFKPNQIGNAISRALPLLDKSVKTGFNAFPKLNFGNRQAAGLQATPLKLAEADCKPPVLREFPIIKGDVFVAGSAPGPHRVLYNSVTGAFCGVVTHVGQANNGFTECI